MQLNRRRFIGAASAAIAGMSVASCGSRQAKLAVAPPPPPVQPPQVAVPQPYRPPLVAEAVAALDAHADKITHRDRIGVVDFSLPSSEARFQLIDLASGRIEHSFLVAHGSGSDPAHTGMLHYFSNVPGSHATSRGAYLTSGTYFGKYGRSQRLIGLDPDNDMALSRAIVIHGAPYVDRAMIATRGRIGRSQGCFALELGTVRLAMELLGEGRLLYASKPA